MPTAAKLVAALCFAAVGWLAANAHVPALGENATVGLFREMTAALGAVIGWRVMGQRAGGGTTEAVNGGLLTSALIIFFALLLFATWTMIQRSLTAQPYDGPMDAVLGIFEIMREQGSRMLTVGVLGVFLVGGVVGGLATQAAGKRWR
jgi:hypothetical protein